METPLCTVYKSQKPTRDGYYIYNLLGVPQHGYVRVANAFLKNDEECKAHVAMLLQSKNFTLQIKPQLVGV